MSTCRTLASRLVKVSRRRRPLSIRSPVRRNPSSSSRPKAAAPTPGSPAGSTSLGKWRLSSSQRRRGCVLGPVKPRRAPQRARIHPPTYLIFLFAPLCDMCATFPLSAAAVGGFGPTKRCRSAAYGRIGRRRTPVRLLGDCSGAALEWPWRCFWSPTGFDLRCCKPQEFAARQAWVFCAGSRLLRCCCISSFNCRGGRWGQSCCVFVRCRPPQAPLSGPASEEDVLIAAAEDEASRQWWISAFGAAMGA